ncbi:EYxxD motif small membrane protein [Metabacillus sp. 84]
MNFFLEYIRDMFFVYASVIGGIVALVFVFVRRKRRVR